MPENTENIKENSLKVPKILTFIMLCIYAPFIEEITFRHSFMGWINKDKKSYMIFFTLLSVVMFDMIHVINLQEFFYYLPLSTALTYVYLKYDRNIVASMLFHSIANAIGFIMILIGEL